MLGPDSSPPPPQQVFIKCQVLEMDMQLLILKSESEDGEEKEEEEEEDMSHGMISQSKAGSKSQSRVAAV